jgi:dTDP-4-amino-4,6-dideoxygalactose transaminase
MFKKTLIAEFFTTISLSQYFDSIYLMTFRLPLLRKWKDIKILENNLLSYLWANDSKIISFYNWRSAIFHALKTIWIKKTNEVIVSWYTCVTVSNAVIQSWAKIIYSDIDKKNLWFNIDELEKNITKNTKVIIVQHTFWKPSNIAKIIEIAKKYNILVIEDCAHSLWSEVNWKKLWTFWDFSIFSTWRDKVISSVTGWFLLINNKDYYKKILKINKTLKLPSILLTLRNINYNLAAKEAYSLYNLLKIGKITIYLSRKLWLITEILTPSEKQCHFNEFNYSLPNSLAYLWINQLNKIELTINHNINIAKLYNEKIDNKKITILFKEKKSEKNNYFRYPILLKNSKEKQKFYNYMKANNVLVWNTWSWENIVPVWSNLESAKYISDSCKTSENISKRILTLPNHFKISKDDAEKIIKLINKF